MSICYTDEISYLDLNLGYGARKGSEHSLGACAWGRREMFKVTKEGNRRCVMRWLNNMPAAEAEVEGEAELETEYHSEDEYVGRRRKRGMSDGRSSSMEEHVTLALELGVWKLRESRRHLDRGEK